ncbi:MAG: DNA-binding response regulator [Chloroflexus sp.]|uniref:response regulator transcription factor n=1 Tax=Chloroflexus sp. TaxID=1904827 RepID=UPI0021DCC637|nr:response regulator transcription factor [Chloroflexus sp.]GIV89237.1 MAG: DNA-binding response regulator [Chloroflexus sp.]
MAFVLVVDDDPGIVRLVRSYLEQAGFRVASAFDGATARRLIRQERPDLVILDLMLPDEDGFDIARSLRSDPATATLPIIMLTARIDDTDRIVGLELGADDYIVKPFNPREVVARVKAVLRRVSGGTVRNRLEQGSLVLDLDGHQAWLGGNELELTPTEFALLSLFMHYPGHAFTRAELLEQGLGYAATGLERTIDSHIKNLRKKLEHDPTAPVIETVYGIGYRLRTV